MGCSQFKGGGERMGDSSFLPGIAEFPRLRPTPMEKLVIETIFVNQKPDNLPSFGAC